MKEYGPAEMMIVAIARMLNDGERVFHGVASPIPMLAILVAQRLYSPGLTYINITGGINARPEVLPKSTDAPELIHKSKVIFPLADIFDLSARGELDTAFLSGAQIDSRGNINSSVIGDFSRPKVRLPGGAGSAALVPTAKRVIVWRAKHDPRIFVENCDFITARGNVKEVVTPLGIFEKIFGRLELKSIFSYSSLAEIREKTGFRVSEPFGEEIGEPTKEEMEVLKELDPERVRDIEF